MKRVLIGLLIFLMFTGLIKIIKAAPDCDYLILIPQHTKEDFENSIFAMKSIKLFFFTIIK